MFNFKPKELKILKKYNLVLEDGSLNKNKKDIAELDEEDVYPFLCGFIMITSFLLYIKTFAFPYENIQIGWKDILKYSSFSKKERKIEDELLNLLEEKLDNIFSFTFNRIPNGETFDWEKYGNCLGNLLIHKNDCYKSNLLDKDFVEFIFKQFEEVDITLIEIDDVCTVVLKEHAEKLICYEEMKKSFKNHLWKDIRVHYEKNLKNLVDNFFKYPTVIEKEVAIFLNEKIKEIFNYIYNNNQKPTNISWKEFGRYLFLLSYHPYRTEQIDLPMKTIDYIRNCFEWKRITVEKQNGKYTIVFAKRSY